MTIPPPVTGFDTLKNSARQHEQASQWDEALAIYLQLLAQHDADPDLHNDVALVYEKIGKGDLAEHHYRRALALDPHFYAAAYNFAQLINAHGSREEKIEAFTTLYILASAHEEREEILQRLEEIVGEKVAICADCRCISTWHQAFQQIAKRPLCPYCAEQAQSRAVPRRVITLLFGGGVVAILLFLMAWHPLLLRLHYSLTRILIFWGALVGGMVVHEMAHIFVALITGGWIHTIMLGAGPVIASRRIGGICVSLHRFPYVGYTLFYYPPVSGLRLRVFLTLLAGPLANVVLIAVALLFLVAIPLPNAVAMYWIPQLVIGANLLHLFINLLPLKKFVMMLGSISLPTDGLALIYILGKREWVNNFLLLHYLTVYGNTDASVQPNFAHVLYAAEAGLALAPNESNLLGTAGVAALELEQWERAYHYLERGVGLTPEYLLLRGIALNNLAYWHVLRGEISQAADLIHRARWLIPWSPFVMGTYGAVLIEQGNYQQGIAALMEGFRRHTTPYAKASMLAYAAKGHALAGRRDEGLALLQQAESYPVQPLIVRRIRESLT